MEGVRKKNAWRIIHLEASLLVGLTGYRKSRDGVSCRLPAGRDTAANPWMDFIAVSLARLFAVDTFPRAWKRIRGFQDTMINNSPDYLAS